MHTCIGSVRPMVAIVCTIALLFLMAVPAPGQQRTQRKLPAIAVLDFDAREGLSRGEAASLSDLFSSQLVATREFIVVDRNRIKAILQEQGFQQSEACSQVECIVEAGRILKVEKMFAGTIGKVGRIFTVNIQLIDVTTAQIQMQRSHQHSGDIEELAQEVIPNLALEMAQEMTGKNLGARRLASGTSSTWYYYVGGAVLLGGGAAYFLLKPQATQTTGTTQTDLPAAPKLP